MNKIKFNGTTEFEIEGYNKNTYFNSNEMTSNANCNINTSDITALNTLAQETITSIQIFSDSVSIYNLQNINARIESFNEYLNGNRMSINLNITFGAAEPANV